MKGRLDPDIARADHGTLRRLLAVETDPRRRKLIKQLLYQIVERAVVGVAA